jgi:hypothetical protein
MSDHAFSVSPPRLDGDRWVFDVDGRRHGPFSSAAEAGHAREALFARWNRRARALGGWVWRPTARVWVVTLPAGAARDLGRPLDRKPITRS